MTQSLPQTTGIDRFRTSTCVRTHCRWRTVACSRCCVGHASIAAEPSQTTRRCSHVAPRPARQQSATRAQQQRPNKPYAQTAFAAQSRTADHVIIHADSKATNLIDQKSFYVGVSRAKTSVAIYTNDRAKLISAIDGRAGVTQTALNSNAEWTNAHMSRSFQSFQLQASLA